MAFPAPMPPDPPGGSVRPARAIVTPRARRLPDGEPLPIERIVWPFLARSTCGVIHLRGEASSGKSTALSHLAAVLPSAANITYLDESDLDCIETAARRGLVIAVGAAESQTRSLATLELCAWDEDELIEYLLAVHPNRCASVMSRVQADRDRAALRGSPELWRAALDVMASDESIQYVATALRKRVESLIPVECRRAAAHECLRRLIGGQFFHIAAPDAPHEASRLLRHRTMQVMLAAERLVESLCEAREGQLLTKFPLDLVSECALRARPRPQALQRLEKIVRSGQPGAHAVAASILLAATPAWRPPLGSRRLQLTHAQLPGARWSEINLANASLDYANFAGAEMNDVGLDDADAMFTDFSDASMLRASLCNASLQNANLTGADLSHARGVGADFTAAVLDATNLTKASLERAIFCDAKMLGARLVQADLRKTDFTSATLDQIDSRGADFSEAKLDHCDLRSCQLEGAVFCSASLVECKLEGITLVGVRFDDASLVGAMLTGSFILGGRFRGASLRYARLADMSCEAADLRGVDFAGASFHLGSTRSGLVGSGVASEGTRTGFYTDDYDDRDTRPAEEIRKANLRGADLRGARVEGTDWYLVDLRGAKYTIDQEAHFKRCGAILDDRD